MGVRDPKGVHRPFKGAQEKYGRRRVPESERDKVLLERSREKGVKHAVPMGAKDRWSRGVMAMVARAGDNLKAMIADDAEMANDYWESLRRGVKLGDRTAMHLYTKILKLVDEEKTVVVMVLQQLGMSSMEDLERLVRTHKDSEGITAEQRAGACADYLELYLNAHPEERGLFVRRFGGEVPVRSDSYAVVER